MSRAIWADSASADLFAIADYYGQIDLGLAHEMLARVAEAPRTLLANQLIGVELEPGGVRKWSVRATPFLLVYEVVGDDIHILRVRHNRQNWRVAP